MNTHKSTLFHLPTRLLYLWIVSLAAFACLVALVQSVGDTNVKAAAVSSHLIETSNIGAAERFAGVTASPPYLVRDINPNGLSSVFHSFIVISDVVYFAASDGIHGEELWKSDGTLTGTVMVRDIYTGAGSSVKSYRAGFTNLNGTLVFVANDGVHGNELWRTDGTFTGTMMIRDIYTDANPYIDPYPFYLMVCGNTLYFVGEDVDHGRELWKSDGTTEGTLLVRDIYGSWERYMVPHEFTCVNDALFFVASNGGSWRLWKTDGTYTGTVMVQDTITNSAAFDPFDLNSVNGTLFFFAHHPSLGVELWKSDGTPAGTMVVKDINPGDSSIFYSTRLVETNGILFFAANDGIHGEELWRSDGTFTGTILLKDIYSGTASSLPWGLRYRHAEVNGTLFFFADDRVSGGELWKTDGTPDGTLLVKDIYTGSNSSDPTGLIAINGALFFQADDGTHGKELWKSDGTFTGTLMVKDIKFGAADSALSSLTDFNSVLLFQVDDGINGRELWKSDGTSVGTMLIKDVFPGANSSNPTFQTIYGGELFFAADDGVHGQELWTSDTTPEGTQLLKDFSVGPQSSSPDGLVTSGDALFFAADDGLHGLELWKSDGTFTGTTLVKDIYTGQSNSWPNDLINVDGTLFLWTHTSDYSTYNWYEDLWKSNGTSDSTILLASTGYLSSHERGTKVGSALFFQVDEIFAGAELWKSAGTFTDTGLFKDINTGSFRGPDWDVACSSYPSYLTNVNGILFFSAQDGHDASCNDHGRELWKSDGTPTDTVMVKDIFLGGSANPSYLTGVKDMLFFAAEDGSHGNELWKSDGTSAGTTLVKDIWSGASSASPHHLTNVNGKLFFVADDGVNGQGLWKSDGTLEGTVFVAAIEPEPGNPSGAGIEFLTAMNDTLYFSAYDSLHGRELWKSDGTAQGTQRVKDINVGSSGSNPQNLTAVFDKLYFTADDGSCGRELWQSDGTPEGTFMVADVYSGTLGSQPTSLSLFINRFHATLFFQADDSEHGRELWATRVLTFSHEFYLSAIAKRH